MKILILAAGSRGDVAPYTGLGVRLRDAGHEVALAAPASFSGLVAESGLEFRGLPADPRAQAAGAQAAGTRVSGGSPGGTADLMRKASAFIQELGPGIADAAAAGADLLLFSTTTAPLGWHVAEALGAPSMGVYLQPVTPTGEFGPVMGGGRSLGRWGNRAAGRISLRVVDRLHTTAAAGLRARLGLPPAAARAVRRRQEASNWPVLHGFSTVLVPRPRDWRDGLDVVGNWWPHCPADRRLPAELDDFLRSGPPPVFIGFGSMGAGEGERLSEIAVEALRKAKVRGVLQAGWAGLSAVGDDVLAVGDVPHALLFPRTAAVVHHAGAGTAAAALRAGVPAIPVPVTADQPFWAGRIASLGAGTTPVPYKELTAGRLAEALRLAVGEPQYRERAAEAARRMEAEDGAARVVEEIEKKVP
ncbi:glycosyltransferase [Streptomyces hiroshimensis]|uniref:Glycosyl transferase n=1 Tax=Streptomyces hiroshimensis TaxID=66424 RepID=A0ABQ2ZFI3_9ACTN|nr:glycosyltransferase [Streptomyces hiroshimensis]GGY10933.1 glycosyl transferase [Streptomyces hiroshimensis]